MKPDETASRIVQLASSADAVSRIRTALLRCAVTGSSLPTGGTLVDDWQEVELGSLGEWGSGGTPLRTDPSYYGGTIPWITIGDLNNGVVTSTENSITRKGLENSSAKLLQPGVLLIAMYGSIGKLGITGIDCATNQAIAFCKPDPRKVELRFLFHLMASLQPELLARGQGLAQKNISQTILKAWRVRIPPLAEQKRIVAKVDELMALCDRLESQLKQRDEQAGVLAKAAVARFQADPTVENLEYLFHASYTITAADLQRALLNLAVRGQLVKQAPADPATDDLISKARIEVGLETWHGHDPQPREIPFEIPKSWRWVTVEDVSISRLGKMLDKGKNRGLARPYLRNTNVHWFRFELESIKEMAFEAAELDEYRVEPGDVLICEGGHGIARSAVWDGQLPGIMFQKALHRVRPLSCLDGHYLTYCLWVFERAGILQRYYTGAGIPHFTGKSLSRVLLPLPPLAEQRRIVAKVNQLMALVDQLESQVTASEEAGTKLLDALVAEIAPSN